VRTAEKQRVEKLLEDAQIKLSVVASDLQSHPRTRLLIAAFPIPAPRQHHAKPVVPLARSRPSFRIRRSLGPRGLVALPCRGAGRFETCCD
jgi:hypothetical protein